MTARRLRRSPHPWRRTYIVNSRLQWKYIALAGLTAFTVSCVTGAGMYFVQLRSLQSQEMGQLLGQVRPQWSTLIAWSAGFAVLMAVGFGAWSVFLTHRICGPIWVMERYFDEVMRGRVPKHRPLRKNDEFARFYARFWEVLDTLAERCDADRRTIDGLKQSLESAQKGLSTPEEAMARMSFALNDADGSVGVIPRLEPTCV